MQQWQWGDPRSGWDGGPGVWGSAGTWDEVYSLALLRRDTAWASCVVSVFLPLSLHQGKLTEEMLLF